MKPEDTRQLELLAVFHYVFGGMLALFSCIPFLHVLMGLAIATGTFFECEDGSSEPDAMFGWIFVIMGSFFIITGWIISICILIAGRKLQRRKNRIFCMAVAGIECMFMPFGTVLGVFTLVALNKDSVKELFAEQHLPGT